MMIVSGGDVGGLVWLNHSGHVEDFGLPIVLPSWDGPEQTFVSDSESHELLCYQIFMNQLIN